MGAIAEAERVSIGGAAMRRSPIAPVSKKRRSENRKRRKLTDAMKREGPVMCGFCGCCRADDFHEIVSRARGGSITDPENCIPLCRPCHDRATTEPVWAAELGLSKRKEGLAK